VSGRKGRIQDKGGPHEQTLIAREFDRSKSPHPGKGPVPFVDEKQELGETKKIWGGQGRPTRMGPFLCRSKENEETKAGRPCSVAKLIKSLPRKGEEDGHLLKKLRTKSAPAWLYTYAMDFPKKKNSLRKLSTHEPDRHVTLRGLGRNEKASNGGD